MEPSTSSFAATTVSIPSPSSSPSYEQQLSPLLFHPYHGGNIELLEHRQRALRRASFDQGAVFSERPLLENEYFFISIETVESGWSGHLRIGLTAADPNSRPDSRNLEHQSWLVSISPSTVPFSSPLVSRSLPTDEGSLIGIYYERDSASQQTRMHVVLNGFDMCPEMADIPSDRPLFAVVDVFGCTKEVRVVVPQRDPDRLSSICSQRVNRLVKEGRCSVNRLPRNLRDTLSEQEQQPPYPQAFLHH